ncbi:MAG: elongation factor G, partial [candidate division Zixibacteria bacterium]|nr:elongation factor G [candidate division Zixibacteria bacterium]
DIPADQKESAEKWRENLIEQVAETDDTLLEKFFEDGSLSDDEIKNGLRKGALNGKVYPTLFGSAENMAGVQLFADFLVSYLPAPLDFEHVTLKKVGTDDTVDIKIDPSAKPVLYFYKTSSEGQSGDTFCFRVMTGSVTPGTELTNHSRGGSERLGQLYVLTGKDRAEVSVLHAGDLGAATKLKDTHTGNSLSTKDNPLVFPEPVYPEPVADAAISPLKKGDEEKMSQGLSRLREADPSFKVVSDPALKQTVLIGQGMTQVENLLERLKKDYGVEVETSKPRIPYRETIRGKTEIQHRYKKQSGGRGQFGDVHLRLEPQARGEGFEFVNGISGGVIPTKFIPSVEKGVREAMIEGQLSGSPIVDLKATVFYGSYHAVDSSDMAFKIAASMAFKEGITQCKPILLEPIFEVEVIAPEKNAGDVMGDVSSRRGKILGMEPDGSRQIVRAHIPQSELYNYSVDLRSMTQGQGRFTRKFSHYEAAPGDVQKKITEEYATSRKEG